MASTPAGELLLIAVAEIEARIAEASKADFGLVTACDPWTVRDVVAHCSGAMLRLIEDRTHNFTPEDNQGDVDERRPWPFADVVAELSATAPQTARRIDDGAGRVDGLGLGVWVHAGDVRQALNHPDPYAGPGIDLALGLLADRSRRLEFSLSATIDGRDITLGAGDNRGTLTTDPETFVRLTGGRDPDPARFRLEGATPTELVLFN